jgi:hypothetical protein
LAKSSGKANPKGTRKVQAERGIFQRVSTNWNEQEVAIRRAARNKVKVDGNLCNSVYAAVVSLGLPVGQHEDMRRPHSSWYALQRSGHAQRPLPDARWP